MTNIVKEFIILRPGDAISVTDVQNDFLPGGALGVPGGDRIIAPLNRIIPLFEREVLPLFFTRDWHPENHCSFQRQGGPWPPHCVRNTWGAAFAATLNIPASAVVISKGTHADREQYSTLYGLDAAGRTENILLKESGAGRIFIAGLATDYCVLNSVRDACKEGFEVIILEDAICAVDVSPGDGARAVAEMIRLGAKITTTDSVRREK